MNKNSLTQNEAKKQMEKMSISNFMNHPQIQKMITNVVGGDRTARFISGVVSAVTTNPELSKCDKHSIVSAALLGESLNLSPSPQLGHYYMVPYSQKAQFQLGYKGYIQLAIRSGQYRDLDVISVKQGELIAYNPFTQEAQFEPISDPIQREKAETIGYFAFFELLNGFRKQLYWTKEQMHAHAMQYSPGYKSDVNKGKQYTFWSKNFDGMAQKTMLRQLIGKWGVMSIDMQEAYSKDMAGINQDGTIEYIDSNEQIEKDITPEEDEGPQEQQDSSENEGPKQQSLADQIMRQ